MSELQISKNDFTLIRIADNGEKPAIAGGEVLVKIDRFAFTANNMTYAVTGDQIGYWQFFPPTPQTDDQAEWGIIPVWGFADVVASNSEGVLVGERLFGYFPPANYLVMKPSKISKGRMIDGAEHRAHLPAGYNSYRRVSVDTNYDARFDNQQMLLFPLFITSFVIWDQLQEESWYGAEQIVILSASSKTSIGLAYALHADETAPKVIGLTSQRNVEFVNSLGLYQEASTYTDLETLDASVPTVIVDMSGNKQVLEKLVTHLGTNMQFCIKVGLTHWDAFEADSVDIKDRSEFFFGPGRIQKRMQDWGSAEFGKRSGQFMQAASMHSLEWLQPITLQGLEGLQERFADLANGRVAPNEGLVVDMSDG